MQLHLSAQKLLAGVVFFLSFWQLAELRAQQAGYETDVITGKASYYSSKFNGRRTANGERLDNQLYNAAHPSLPFGTYLYVTNLNNDKSVIVRVNDRFHPRKGHLLDLTRAAASDIDMIRTGMARISMRILSEDEAIALMSIWGAASGFSRKDTLLWTLSPKPINLPTSFPPVKPSAILTK